MRLYRHGSSDALVDRPKRGDGRRKHFMYGAWAGMINRCYNPNNSSFHNYGGRGVTVCDEWRSDFMAFLRDMGERPDGKTLDRIDPNGPYEKGNCRWASLSEQRRNWSETGAARARLASSEAMKNYWAGGPGKASHVLTKGQKTQLNTVMQIRCSEEQRIRIDEAAQMEGLSTSEWVRKTVLAAARRERLRKK